MTTPHELVWNHAIDNEDFSEAERIARLRAEEAAQVDGDKLPVSSAVREQRAILAAAAYWGLDYGSLPNNEP